MCGDDKELLEKVTPQYPPGGKRILFDNGNWIRALHRDNVQLVTQPIAEINETGVKTADGTQYDADVLIYGTGFMAAGSCGRCRSPEKAASICRHSGTAIRARTSV